LPGAGQQRLDVFEHRRHDQLVAVQAEGVEHLATQSSILRASDGKTSAIFSGKSQFGMGNSDGIVKK
jgi:hypothetical protein